MAILVEKDVVWFDVAIYKLDSYLDGEKDVRASGGVDGQPIVEMTCLFILTALALTPCQDSPVDEAQLVHRFDRQQNFSHVEPSNIRSKGLVFDEHGHQITAGQKLHEHVQERLILEGGMKLHDPRTVRLRQNITFCTNMRQLVFLEHLRLHQALQSIYHAIRLALYQLNLTKRTFSDDLDSGEVVCGLDGSKVAEMLDFLEPLFMNCLLCFVVRGMWCIAKLFEFFSTILGSV